jgi:hypothetical protein
MGDTNSVESKAENGLSALFSMGKKNLNTVLQLAEEATEAVSAWQNEVLKFADMRLSANMKLLTDVTEVKDASDFVRLQAEHVSNLYEHASNAAVGYSQRIEDILRAGSKDNPSTCAKQGTGSKRQNVDA